MTDEQLAGSAADAMVARAIESVLDAMPTGPVDETPAELAKYQPWADTGAPTGKNKRPLDALLAELRDRVEAEPDAMAAQPGGKRPGLAYFDRFGGPRREGAPVPGAGKRRRRGRGGGGEGAGAGAPTRDAGQRGQSRPPARSGQPPRDQGARRPPKDAVAPGGQRPPGTEGSRRRRRRRGGRSGSGGGGGGQGQPGGGG